MRHSIYRPSGLVVDYFPNDCFSFSKEAFSVELKRVPRVITLNKMISRTSCNCCCGEDVCKQIIFPKILENKVKAYFFKVGGKMCGAQIRNLYKNFGGIADPMAQLHINAIDEEFAEEFPSCSSFVDVRGEQIFSVVHKSGVLDQRSADFILDPNFVLGSEFWLTMVNKTLDPATFERY